MFHTSTNKALCKVFLVKANIDEYWDFVVLLRRTFLNGKRLALLSKSHKSDIIKH